MLLIDPNANDELRDATAAETNTSYIDSVSQLMEKRVNKKDKETAKQLSVDSTYSSNIKQSQVIIQPCQANNDGPKEKH